ncbi:phosphotransferase [Promicromonospora thailandica]|uniref:Phosphotransferase family enzyme n=1 Tax=Promicromonospora thailandica TaxID=765201 RepID=A0A9X2FXN3_9MICO|nr:phosphotransferase [Promicromonospora thailandica]MCP2263039.1 hypothetical protein [Promicromonospora thailandica]BFF18410.1 hypothetical protein GCM10025730_19310 [Promicromonospora thailandica]
MTRRERLDRYLARAAERFGVRPDGTPVAGDFDRTLAVRVSGAGGAAWLRVTAQPPAWAAGDGWDGIAAATGAPFDQIPMPRHLATAEWTDDGDVVRADLVTHVGHPAVTTGLVLRHDVDLPDAWWAALRSGLEPLRRVRTGRAALTPQALADTLLATFGLVVDLDRVRWETAHGDLHLGNLTAPELTILDWETWGRAPAGYDAAVLACSAVLRPTVADRVRAEFADVLGTYSGAVAQLAAADRYLALVRLGRHRDVALPLRRHAESLLRDLRRD